MVDETKETGIASEYEPESSSSYDQYTDDTINSAVESQTNLPLPEIFPEENAEESIREKKALPQEILETAIQAEKEAEKATQAAVNASIAAKAVFDGDYSQEMISEKIHQARIDLTKHAEKAAQAALHAQESAREAAAAAIHKAEENAAQALSELHEAERELTKISSLTEKAEESALEAKDAAALAAKMAETENQKAAACKNALKAANILVTNAQMKYKATEEVLNHTREEAIEAEKRLATAKQSAIAASLEAQTILGKIENEAPVKSVPVSEENPVSPSGFRRFMRGLWTTFKLVFVAALIALLLRTYVFDITKVVGSSMDPALADGDNLFTSKISYDIGEPQRGDIVIIDAPDQNGEYYVKRIIGLPNEEILIQNGLVYIDGVLLDEPYLQDNCSTTGDTHMIIEDGAYFVMGDNRGNSHDSRDTEVGTILKDQIRGKAVFRLYPWDRFGSVY